MADASVPGPSAPPPLLHVVQHEPEIPNNTGNIGRTCVAVGAALHLIHPLGFELTDHACRRAGLDYWPRLDLTEHASFDAYLDRAPADRIWVFTAREGRPPHDAEFAPGDHVLFGRESVGLPEEVVRRRPDRCVRLPMAPGERSLNVATVVCVALYEAIRQFAVRGEVSIDETGSIRRVPSD